MNRPKADAPASALQVSVIVPHYRDLGGLARLLDSLDAQTWPRARREIIVADNDSPEGEASVAQVISGRAHLVTVKERGAGPARNGAVAEASGDILAFIDSDCVAEPEWIERGVQGLVGHNFIGGRVKVLVADERRMTAAEAFERVFAFDFETYILKKGFTGSGNLFCSRSVFDRVGGFRTGVAEDVDWSHRARAAGFRLGYAPEAVVGHPARRTWPALREKWRKTDVEGFGLYRERRWGRALWAIRALALPPSALAHIPKVLSSRNLATAAQRLAAIAMLARVRLWRFGDCLKLALRSR
ncbi:MAG: glycosyltransferase [Caulobacteraceae bacterium]